MASRSTRAHGDLGDALELAGKLAARSGDAQVLVATDGALCDRGRRPRSPRPVTVLPVGRERKNQAIVALAVRTAPSAVTRSVFVSVANLDLERAAAAARGLAATARSSRSRDLHARSAGPRRRHHRRRAALTSATVEVRLVGPDRASTARPTSSPSTTRPGRSCRPTGCG